ncbi:MAG TPA: 4-hydroxy-3-methylbut-2-enyl diphosphate reductase [Armatimonadaceae bacterium]|nr:4-hydroxy-3-methylbut-2-enyl diphosphate reductase [Armatimonadaceae bacterium]
MKVLLAAPRGFCAGVDRAIEIVEMALEVYGPPIYVRHEIIHNEHVVARLRERGAIFTDYLSEVPRGSNLVFSAHGVSPAVRAEAAERNLNVIDATCPLVTKIHLEVHKFLKRGYGIFFIGHRGHVETEGTLGEAPDRLVLVTTEEEVDALPEPTEEKLIYLTQTTLSIDETRGIVEALKRRFPRLSDPPGSDICYATQNRQDAVKQLARQSDVILVVGSQTSSNSRSLRQVAAAHGVRAAYLIDGRENITDEMIGGAGVVGVTAGASAPEDVIQGVVDEMRLRGATSVEEFVLLEEDVEFKLPPGLVQLYAGSRGPG